MKRLKTIYTLLLLAVALPLITACTNDDAVGDDTRKGEKVTVRLRISQATPAMTRAEWEDKNATDDEMMNVWTVVAVKGQDGTVVNIWACKPKGGNQEEIDEISEIEAELDANTSYRFYSFANISPAKVMSLLNIPSAEVTDNDNTKQVKADNFDGVGDNVIKQISFASASIDAGFNPDVQVNGNFSNPSAADNGFGAKGIPMSNVQTFTSLNDGDRKDLIVVRMLAKMELWLYNDKGTNLNIKSITLTDITKDASENSDKANLKLFPRYTIKTPNGADEKVDYEHGDIHPNLATGATTTDLTITPSSSGVTVTPATATQSDKWAITNKYVEKNGYPDKDKAVVISFYVNESATPTHDFKHFFLELEIENDANATLIDDKKQRYTLIGGVGETYTEDNPDEWNYIARNDYRIIPIVLDDYKLDMIPYDFPAIGVHPASMKEEDGIYTITFHDYGHFHLQPQVTKYSNGNVVPYGAGDTTGDHWALYGNNFSSAWGSWIDATKEKGYSGDFYRTSVTGSVDGDDAGGEPVWYKNDGTDGPQWKPNATVDYQPFIFGYIADPEEKPETDKKVYHEFSINLYKQGTGAARQMAYRLYMILDQDQMMYPDTKDPNGSRAIGAPATRHTHGH